MCTFIVRKKETKMKRFIIVISSLMIILAGCSNTSSTTDSSASSKKNNPQPIGKMLNSKTRMIWFHTTDGPEKDAIIDTIYVSNSGKITTYVVYDGISVDDSSKLTLGNIQSLSDDNIINKAKKLNTITSNESLKQIISSMEYSIKSGENELMNSDSIFDGNYSETLTSPGGEKTKEQHLAEVTEGVKEAKAKVEELRNLNKKGHEMFDRTPIGVDINLTTDSTGNSVERESISITKTVFNSNLQYSNLNHIGFFLLDTKKINLNYNVNFSIYKGYYAGFSINENSKDLFVKKVKSDNESFSLDGLDSKYKNISIDDKNS